MGVSSAGWLDAPSGTQDEKLRSSGGARSRATSHQDPFDWTCLQIGPTEFGKLGYEGIMLEKCPHYKSKTWMVYLVGRMFPAAIIGTLLL